MVGFLHVFANMQMKLSQVFHTYRVLQYIQTPIEWSNPIDWTCYLVLHFYTKHVLISSFFMLATNSHFCFVQDSSQIDLLKELMDLQKDMVVMLLSLLEGRHSFPPLHQTYYEKLL